MVSERLKEIAQQVYKFHTKVAPGIFIGVVMVDYAQELLGEVKGKINAVAETQACISDVIQIMAGCTIGNRYLRILPHLGRYALSLFDRENGEGIRVYVDINKIDQNKTPELHKFFCRKRDLAVQKGGRARSESCDIIIKEFEQIGRGILSYEKIKMKQYGKPDMLAAAKCQKCGETFLADRKTIETATLCGFCTGLDKYFDTIP